MGTRELDLKFLDGIELNEPKVKAVRFNDDEIYMLKFIAYKGMKFSSYVKQLVVADIRNYCIEKESNTIGSIDKEDIKEIVIEILRDNNYIKQENKEEIHKDNIITNNKENDDAILALTELGISRR